MANRFQEWLYRNQQPDYPFFTRVGIAERLDSFLHCRKKGREWVCAWYDREIERQPRGWRK